LGCSKDGMNASQITQLGLSYPHFREGGENGSSSGKGMGKKLGAVSMRKGARLNICVLTSRLSRKKGGSQDGWRKEILRKGGVLGGNHKLEIEERSGKRVVQAEQVSLFSP